MCSSAYRYQKMKIPSERREKEKKTLSSSSTLIDGDDQARKRCA